MRQSSGTFAFVAVLLTTAACSGSSGSSLPADKLDHDASAAFGGRWSGTVTLSAEGQTQSTPAEIDAIVTGRNELNFPGFCGDGSGPSARVTSDDAFTVASHGCSIGVDSCTASWRIEGGSGSLLAGTLHLSVSGPVSGCGVPSGTQLSLTFDGVKPATFTVYSLSPSSVEAGSPGFTLQVSGYGFPSDAVVFWNGSARTTTFVNSSLLEAQIGAADVAAAAMASVTVVSTSGGASYPLTFQVLGLPAPSLYSITPSSVVAGSGAFTLQVNGSSFRSETVVLWNGSPRTTTFLNDSSLQAQITAEDISAAGTVQVTVAHGPGGEPSWPLSFQILAPQPGVTILSLPVRDMVWDPVRQRIYVSLDNTSPTNPNTITTVDPFTGTFDAGVFAGSQPNRLAVSADGQFLYAGLDGAAAVGRFTLPALVRDLTIPLGTDPIFSRPLTATDLAVAPGAAATFAVSLNDGTAGEGGLAIYDAATARTNRAAPFAGTGNIYSSITWGADATALYAANAGHTGFDFYTMSVDASGVSALHDYGNRFSSFTNRIHFDPVTRLVYSDDGHVLDPVTGNPAGTFGVYGPMIPDGASGVAIFVTTDYYASSTATVRMFDLTRFTPLATFVVQRLSGEPTGRVLRWGSDGIAFTTSTPGQAGGQLVLVHLPH